MRTPWVLFVASLPRISCRLAGTSGYIGPAGAAAAGANPLDVAAGDPFAAGAARLAVPVFAVTSGFTAAFVAFAGALSAFPAGLTVFSLPFAAVADASQDVPTPPPSLASQSAPPFAQCSRPSLFNAQTG